MVVSNSTPEGSPNTRKILILGFGIVKIPTHPDGVEVQSTQIKTVGLAISDIPSRRLIAGYGSSFTTLVPMNSTATDVVVQADSKGHPIISAITNFVPAVEQEKQADGMDD